MQKEKKIRVIEIILEILKKWKLILILAVVCAVLLGAFQFVKLNGSEIPVEEPKVEETKKEEKKPEITYEEYLQQIAYNTDRVDYYTELYNETKEYSDNSYLMSIDPYNCATATSTCIFYGEPDYNATATSSYVTVIKNIDCYTNAIARGTAIEDLEGQYIRELISVSQDSSRFTVSVVAADKFTAEKILTNLIECAEKEINLSQDFLRVASSLGWEFSPVISDVYYNSGLRNSQISLSKELIGYDDSIVKFEDALRKLNKEYGSIYVEGYVEPDPNAKPESKPETARYSASEAAKLSVKYAIIGLIIGVVIGIAIAFIKVLTHPKLCYSRQIFEDTGIKFFGNIEETENIKRLNKLCKKISGDKEFMSPRTERLTYTIANINSFAKGKRLLVTGTVSAADAQAAIDELTANNKDLQLIYKGNLTLNAAAVKALDDADAILIMEQTGTTAVTPLSTLTDSCRFTDKDIIGYVII